MSALPFFSIEYGKAIDKAVFPGLQGGPLQHVIAAKAVCFKAALEDDFKVYSKQVIENAKACEKGLREENITILHGGTENHMLLLDLRPLGIKGKLAEAMLCGTPSVTTSVGAEGMHNDLPWNGFVAKDIADFITKSVTLYSDGKLWNESQQNGIAIINQLYDKEKLSPVFRKKIIELASNLKAHRTQNFMGSILQYQTLRSTKYMSKWIEAKNKTF